ARLGGDEFTVLLDDIKDPSDAKRAADRLMKALASPFLLGGKEVFTSVSIGIALSTSAYENPEDILRDADTAMYRAKSLGKARCGGNWPHTRARLVEFAGGLPANQRVEGRFACQSPSNN